MNAAGLVAEHAAVARGGEERLEEALEHLAVTLLQAHDVRAAVQQLPADALLAEGDVEVLWRRMREEDGLGEVLGGVLVCEKVVGEDAEGGRRGRWRGGSEAAERRGGRGGDDVCRRERGTWHQR